MSLAGYGSDEGTEGREKRRNAGVKPLCSTSFLKEA
jgi:hypothetical protein